MATIPAEPRFRHEVQIAVYADGWPDVINALDEIAAEFADGRTVRDSVGATTNRSWSVLATDHGANSESDCTSGECDPKS